MRFALLLAACLTACSLPTETPTQEVGGAPAAQALASAPFVVSNNNDPIQIGQSYLKLAVECMAATYPNDYFEFTSFTDKNYRLTSHDHEVNVGYSFTQRGALNVADVWTRINSPSAPWIHRSYVWSLVQQASEPDGGRVDFKVGPPNGSQQIQTQASCTLMSLFNQQWAVMGATIPGN